MPAESMIEVTVMELALPIGHGRLPNPSRPPARSERRVHGALGLGSLLLHGLAAFALIASTRTLELPVRRGAAGAFEQGPREAAAMLASFIDTAADAPGEIVTLERPAIEWLEPPTFASVAAPALEDLSRLATVDEETTAAAVGIDESERLRGIYRAQLQARIERAWERPDLVQAGLAFSCAVTLTELSAPAGPLMDFSACEASEALRSSLATAIRRALPLPVAPSGLAPPRGIVLEFSAP